MVAPAAITPSAITATANPRRDRLATAVTIADRRTPVTAPVSVSVSVPVPATVPGAGAAAAATCIAAISSAIPANRSLASYANPFTTTPRSSGTLSHARAAISASRSATQKLY